jgi:hypothetical protein
MHTLHALLNCSNAQHRTPQHRHLGMQLSCCCATTGSCRKLFGESDEAVRKGLLQVFVRVKPVTRKLERCMTIEKEGQLVKAVWCDW